MKKPLAVLCTGLASLAISGCRIGPTYVRPSAPTPPAFKELPPAPYDSNAWRVASPAESAMRGEWWKDFHDSQLNGLESHVDEANQELKEADAHYRTAVAFVKFHRADKAPTIDIAPFLGAERESFNQPYFVKMLNDPNGVGDLSLPFSFNYEVDLWGRIRRQVEQAGDNAQATAADRENIRLSLHAAVASDYFNLRAADAQDKLLRDTVTAYQEALQLTEDRFNGGAAPESDVTQARTQLDAATVLETDIAVERAQFEHAIAVLIGEAPHELNLPQTPLNVQPPDIPVVPGLLPAQLLERRPDIGAAERRMAAANEQIGIAKAAFYPQLNLAASAGVVGTSALNWFTWPARFFSVGGAISETLYDHGRRASLSEIARANYDASVASYRQTTLNAFGEVEDNLAALRQLEIEQKQQREATAAAQSTLELFNTRYEGGVDAYLQVVISQTTLLQNQRNEIDIQSRRLDDTISLYRTLGGGWNVSQLPKP
jgi:NodT family efflux transporter outer membrane factor (OMF) lipoprotein